MWMLCEYIRLEELYKWWYYTRITSGLWNRFKLQSKDTLLWDYEEIVYSRISIYENKYLHVELGWVGGAKHNFKC